MLKPLTSPFLVIALLLGGFSAFLAYKGQYEAAMAGAGVAVAAATARTNKDEDSEESIDKIQARLYREQYEQLRNEIHKKEQIFLLQQQKLMQIIERAEDVRKYERELDVLRQRVEQQDRIKEKELEIERLKQEKQLLSREQEFRSLPESTLEVFQPEATETQIPEELGDEQDYL